MPTSPFSLRLAPELRDRLETEARLEDRSASYLAQKAIETFLDAREQKRAAIRAAVVEADRGEFISGDSVDAWIASWGGTGELPPPEPNIRRKSK